ncbi:MAG: NAD-dependent epimerase/dehydratase family protein, partial [Candidatus Odinarchaeia archaeon]
MVNTLVIGGAGFIGSNLVARLIENKEKVSVVDNLMTGNLNNLKDIRSSIQSITDDILKLDSKKISEFDIIYYLGMPSSSPMYKENPHLVNKTVKEAQHLLEITRKNSFNGKIILDSSSSLYNSNTPPYREDMLIKVTDFYTECRYYIERLFELYHNLYQTNYLALRFFSVYGPKEEYKGKYANMVTQFLWCYLKNETPVIYGDGSQTRDFIYVDDVVSACIKAAKSDLNNEVFNIGTGIELSFNDILQKLNNHFGLDIKPKYVENPIRNYVQRTLADTTKTESMLGFKPKTSIS